MPALHLFLGVALGACLPVEGDRILVADLAAAIPAFSGANAGDTIGFTPFPGSQRRFSAGEVSRLAAKYGVAVEPAPVCFEYKLEALTKERILAALRKQLPPETQVEISDFSRVGIPKGPLEFPREGLATATTASPRDPLIWRGRLRYAAAQSLPVWAKVTVWVLRSGVVAERALTPGKPIAAADVRIAEVETGPFAEAPAASTEEVTGLTPRRAVRAGQGVPISWLAPQADVNRGEMVGIEAHYGAAFLKFQVRAESAGRVGEVVQVRNVQSGKSFPARVIRRGWVAAE